MRVGQAPAYVVVVEGQPRVVPTEHVQNGSVKIVDRDRILHRVVAEHIGGYGR